MYSCTPRFVGVGLGVIRTADRNEIEVDVPCEAMLAVLFDALAVG